MTVDPNKELAAKNIKLDQSTGGTDWITG